MTSCNLVIRVMFVVAAFAGDSALAGDAGDVVHTTSGGELGLELRADYLDGFGIEVMRDGSVVNGRARERADLSDGWDIAVSTGQFGQFISGRMQAGTGLSLRFGQAEVKLEALQLVPAEDNGRPVIEIHDRNGLHLLSITHVHVTLRAAEERIEIRHGDLVAGPALAEALDAEVLSGMVVGSGWLDLSVAATQAGDDQLLASSDGSRGLSCSGRPFWPQDGHVVDVALTHIGVVQYQGTESTEGTEWVKLAPSATLKNVGTGDVPWIAKFEENILYPHEPEDQHPYLVWSLYRIHDGRIEQLAVSGAKHAFNTINRNCDISCGYLSGDVLGPGCEDDYGAETNDQNGLMGPRDEIKASRGRFESIGSFFDENKDGTQEVDSGPFENRLLVDAEELEFEGAEYFVDAWYVVQCDADIWNSMGYRQVDPEAGQSGGWTFGLVSGYRPGPVIDEWLAEGFSGWSGHATAVVPSSSPGGDCPENRPQGHARMLVRVEPEPDGRYRYIYALQNFDIDRGIDRVTIPLADGASVSDISVSGPDISGWSGSSTSGEIVFETADRHMPWMALYNFEFVSSASPARGDAVLGLVESDPPEGQVIDTIVPGDDLIYSDRFIDLALGWMIH